MTARAFQLMLFNCTAYARVITGCLDEMHTMQMLNFLKNNHITRDAKNEPWILSNWTEISSPFIMDKKMENIGRVEFSRRLKVIFDEQIGHTKIRPASRMQIFSLHSLSK